MHPFFMPLQPTTLSLSLPHPSILHLCAPFIPSSYSSHPYSNPLLSFYASLLPMYHSLLHIPFLFLHISSLLFSYPHSSSFIPSHLFLDIPSLPPFIFPPFFFHILSLQMSSYPLPSPFISPSAVPSHPFPSSSNPLPSPFISHLFFL